MTVISSNAVPEAARTTKLSGPLKSGFGVYPMTFEYPVPLALATPLEAAPDIVQSTPLAAVSVSVAFRVRLNAVGLPSSSMATATGSVSVISGGSLIGEMVTLIV